MWRAVWFCEDDFSSYWILVPKNWWVQETTTQWFIIRLFTFRVKRRESHSSIIASKVLFPLLFYCWFWVTVAACSATPNILCAYHSPSHRDSGNAISTTLLTDFYFYSKVIKVSIWLPVGNQKAYGKTLKLSGLFKLTRVFYRVSQHTTGICDQKSTIVYYCYFFCCINFWC